MLETPSFTQLKASRATGVSLGLVNRITNWLVSRGYVAKRKDGYNVLAPAALAEQFSFFRRMEELEFANFEVEVGSEELGNLLKQTRSVLCLTSALQRFDDYFRDPSIHAYAQQEAIQAFKELPLGRTSITLYRDDLKQEDDFDREETGFRPMAGGQLANQTWGEVLTTKKTRTIIDVLCSKRAYAAENLIKKTW